MKRRISRIAPWQAAKVLSILYFIIGFVIAIPSALFSIFVPPQPGQDVPGIGFFLAMPFLYALASLVFVPLGCWIYNTVAKRVGGIEVSVEQEDDV